MDRSRGGCAPFGLRRKNLRDGRAGTHSEVRTCGLGYRWLATRAGIEGKPQGQHIVVLARMFLRASSCRLIAARERNARRPQIHPGEDRIDVVIAPPVLTGGEPRGGPTQTS